LSEQLASLKDVVSAKGQYANYRKALKVAPPPVVPFLGVYLTDLTFVDLGNVDYLPDTNYINFDKRRKVATIVNEVQAYQGSVYYLEDVIPLQNFLIALDRNGLWPDEKVMYSISLQSEPRDEEEDDDE
jgi:hypothetical protein